MNKPFTTNIYNNDVSDSSLRMGTIIGFQMTLVNNMQDTVIKNISGGHVTIKIQTNYLLDTKAYVEFILFINKHKLTWTNMYDILFTVNTQYSNKLFAWRQILIELLNEVEFNE